MITSDMVMSAKSLSSAWNILTSMGEDKNSNRTKENAKKNIDLLAVIVD